MGRGRRAALVLPPTRSAPVRKADATPRMVSEGECRGVAGACQHKCLPYEWGAVRRDSIVQSEAPAIGQGCPWRLMHASRAGVAHRPAPAAVRRDATGLTRTAGLICRAALSVTRPRGILPIPSAASKEIVPVELTTVSSAVGCIEVHHALVVLRKPSLCVGHGRVSSSSRGDRHTRLSLVDGVTSADVDFLRLRRSRVHEVVEGARTSTRS
jgi:hypothetical protein